MEAYQVLILIGFILVTVYVVMLIYVMSKVHYFSHSLKSRRVAISVLFSEKKDILMAIGEGFKSNKANLGKADKAELIRLSEIKVSSLSEQDIMVCSAQLKESQKRINYIAMTNPYLAKEESYQSYVSSLHDIDSNYRKSVALYNSDVQAFNYWIRSPLTSWLAYLSGHRKKSLLY